MEYELLDQSSDSPRTRVYEVGNNKLRATRTDPYGFIHVSFERGQVPNMLSGMYTTWDEAHKDITRYINEKTKEPKTIQK